MNLVGESDREEGVEIRDWGPLSVAVFSRKCLFEPPLFTLLLPLCTDCSSPSIAVCRAVKLGCKVGPSVGLFSVGLLGSVFTAFDPMEASSL